MPPQQLEAGQFLWQGPESGNENIAQQMEEAEQSAEKDKACSEFSSALGELALTVVHLLGPPGTGKSHLATALGVAAVKAGKRVYRATLAELIEALVKAEPEGRLADKLRFYARTALLIIDEIGYLPIAKGGGNLFFQLVSDRYEKGASYRLRGHTDRVPEHVRANAPITPPPPPKRRANPPTMLHLTSEFTLPIKNADF